MNHIGPARRTIDLGLADQKKRRPTNLLQLAGRDKLIPSMSRHMAQRCDSHTPVGVRTRDPAPDQRRYFREQASGTVNPYVNCI
ncbi:hypothetical protein GCM10022232_50690 [Streptomyces plumbiresistens]|uniref:Uncharacterized protein n=1 Tax=Streptomyces plumbiresistens TaxID=511811 RepID=A0ABP7S0V0_9ACTN